MGVLISCQAIKKSYSSRPLFQEISFGIEDEERLGLIGPNGSGKSTLLKILCKNVEPDAGQVVSRRNLSVAYVPQDESFDADHTIVEIVTEAAQQSRFEEYERAAAIESTLQQVDFPDREALAGSLSGGWRKRLALACAIVQQPELLLMDEPTNHLDLEGVLWLEQFLKSSRFAYAVISHDRAFLENISTRIIELNPTYPQGFISTKGNYSQFLVAREEQLNAQAHQQKALASKVRRELAWLARGARARQTKSRGRIEEAGKLIEELAEVKQRNSLNTSMEIGFDASGRKAKELLSLKGVAKSFGEKSLFKDLSFVLSAGTKLGLVGRNGSGKTTLLRLLVGEIAPDAGVIKQAQDLKIVWFDQNRKQLDQTKTLRQSLSAESDSVVYRGRSYHITTWAKKFLFRPDQLDLTINYLSGGEQARILIANLMLKTADILILDEPTNDLDIPSLEVLEESLEDFPGAVILVSHDRMLLDSVSNHILAIDGAGGARFFADYEQCEEALEQMRRVEAAAQEKPSTNRSIENAAKARFSSKPKVFMSTAEKRELAKIPEKIDQLEKSLADKNKELEQPENASDYAKLKSLTEERGTVEHDLEALFKRWAELEAKLADSQEVKAT
jgi:ATP-binding cassette subfamily F protein uup